MANTYKASSATDSGAINYHILPYTMANGMGQLHYDLTMTRLVRNYSAEARNQGTRMSENVRIPFTGSVSATNKVAGTQFTPSAATSTKIDLAINTHKVWAILVEDWGSLFTGSGVLQTYMNDGMHAIAEEIENDVIGLYAGLSNSVGSAEGNLTDAVVRETRKTLRENKAPMSQPFFFLIGTEGEYDALGIDRFVLANESGKTDALENARLGTKYGFEFYTSNLMPAITGSPSGEHCIAFQRDAFGIAFVDMATADVPETAVDGHLTQAMNFPDSNGNPTYSMRTIISRSHKDLGTIFSIDTMYGVQEIRDALAVDVLV